MPLLTNSPTNPDPITGVRRLDLWSEDTGTSGAFGDMARGTAYTARYLSEDGSEIAELAIYPVQDENDGSFGVEEMVTSGAAIDDGGVLRPDDSAEIEYDWADVRIFDSLEAAQKRADELGQIDYSYALHLQKGT